MAPFGCIKTDSVASFSFCAIQCLVRFRYQVQSVFDIVYNPLETRLLRDARSRGCSVVSGVEMFINQAVLQFEKFTGTAAPQEIMRRVVLERLGV